MTTARIHILGVGVHPHQDPAVSDDFERVPIPMQPGEPHEHDTQVHDHEHDGHDRGEHGHSR